MRLHLPFLVDLCLLLGVGTSAPIIANETAHNSHHRRGPPSRLPDPFLVLLKTNASMTATKHATWADKVQDELPNERNLPGVGEIYDKPVLQGYTGSFTPEAVKIIEDHPDVRVVHDDTEVWLKETGQEGRVDHRFMKDD